MTPRDRLLAKLRQQYIKAREQERAIARELACHLRARPLQLARAKDLEHMRQRLVARVSAILADISRLENQPDLPKQADVIKSAAELLSALTTKGEA